MKYGTWYPRFYEVGDDRYPSVTTIKSVLDTPALRQWTANCAIEYYKAHSLPDGRVIEGTRDEVLEAARFAHKGISDEALDIGSHWHSIVEWHNWRLLGVDKPKPKMNKIEKKMLANYVVWCEKYEVEPTAIEEIVVGDGYAGTADMIANISGRLWGQKGKFITLIDFKTSKQYYDDMGMQIAAYAQAAETVIQREGIVRLEKKTGSVNFKDYTKEHDVNLKAFLLLKDFYWLANELGERKCLNQKD